MIKRGTSEYRMVHLWAEKTLGKPSLCAHCGTTKYPHFDWANISKEYRQDPSDWIRLCRPCHFRHDRDLEHRYKGLCIRGHKLTPDNIYIQKNRSNHKECLTCKNMHRKARYERMKKLKELENVE